MKTVAPLLLAATLSAASTSLFAGPTDAAPDRMAWWRDARFGLFIHWGLYAIPAGKWGDADHHGEWILTTAQIPVERYEEFVPRFDPVAFDAAGWARMAKDAGMKYVVITTKHHDGFALFDSAVSDYDVMATPFRRDVMKELADACRARGLTICWYHSIMDWHHPDYLPRRDWERRGAEGADFDRYVAYLRAQVTELLTHYDDVGVMWFDGEWEATWSHAYGRALYDLCRTLQPNVIVNNRVDVGRAGIEGFTRDAGRAGDFGTPEQTIPDTGVPGVDWETCMTMNRNWGFNAADHDWKPAAELIRKLIDIASKGGNFLLNVGPRADGTFPPEAVERLAAIGDWMDVHGEAIHGTHASPVERPEWGRVTMKPLATGETILYLHLFEWPPDGVVTLDGLGNEIVEARLLGDPGREVVVQSDGGRHRFLVDGVAPHPIASVIAARISSAPVVYAQPRIEADGHAFTDSIEVALSAPPGGVEVRYERLTGGATDAGVTTDAGVDVARGRTWDGSPIVLEETTTVRAQSFHHGRPVSAPIARTFTKVLPRPALAVDATTPGVDVRIFRGQWDALPDFSTLRPVAEEQAERVALPDRYGEENVARVYQAYLDVPEDGMWTFALESDDGSRLLVDGIVVVDNDGLHGPTQALGAAALAAGPHALRVEWFNRSGGATLALRFGRPGGPLDPLPAVLLRRAAGAR